MDYPFNDKSSLTLGSGENENISSGDIVIYEKTFLGEVTESFPRFSVFKTVFNPGWEFPVYIGSSLARGLFKAGAEPKVVLISKKEKIALNDLIVVADPKLAPFNLVIGKVGRIDSDESSPFWEVSVEVPYNLNDLRNVLVVEK